MYHVNVLHHNNNLLHLTLTMGYDKQTLNAIYDKTDGYCHLCDKKLSRTNYNAHGAKGAWHVDHSKALYNGGTHHMNNLFAACISCNLEKGTLHKTTIRKRKGYGAESSRKSYKKESSSGCFITTACIRSKGLPDDCHELQLLRNFRDTYVASSEQGTKLINEYYRTAPLIVQQINDQDNANEIYSDLYYNIKKAVSLIECEKYSTAFDLYCNLVRDLKKDYLVPTSPNK